MAVEDAGACSELVCDGEGGQVARADAGACGRCGTCAADAEGNARECSAGECVYVCPRGTCTTESGCRSGEWECAEPSAPPRCVTRGPNAPDGQTCAQDSVCYAGRCAHGALVNGDFAMGQRGWTASGDALQFATGIDLDASSRPFVSTRSADAVGDESGSLRGALTQDFTVPSDALALRFWVYGGHAHVRLRDPSGTIVEDVIGPDSNALRVPVSWDLQRWRGQRVAVALEDELDASSWGFVSVNGFDVVRDVPLPLANPLFSAQLDGWQASGDASYFNVFDDFDYAQINGDTFTGLPAYGMRRSVSSYVRQTSAPRKNEAAIGTLSQPFIVPADAIALRFNIHGGKLGRIYLAENDNVLRSVSGIEDDARKIPVTWDLIPYRGKTLTLAIEDTATGSWGYIGTTGFDLITSYNGP